jgi:hypothetical protein
MSAGAPDAPYRLKVARDALDERVVGTAQALATLHMIERALIESATARVPGRSRTRRRPSLTLAPAQEER